MDNNLQITNEFNELILAKNRYYDTLQILGAKYHYSGENIRRIVLKTCKKHGIEKAKAKQGRPCTKKGNMI